MAQRNRKSHSTGIFIFIILILLSVIAFLVWGKLPASLFSTGTITTTPVRTTSKPKTTTPVTVASSTEPLSSRVYVTTPIAGTTVGTSFRVAGTAPNSWYFEAVFPIQVRDPDDNLIASAQGHATTDWTVPGPVAFTATITLKEVYVGPANLIIVRDNPSGLPENADLVTIPITIK